MNKDLILQALEIAWKGMLSVFIAMAIIFIFILLFSKIMKPKNGN